VACRGVFAVPDSCSPRGLLSIFSLHVAARRFNSRSHPLADRRSDHRALPRPARQSISKTSLVRRNAIEISLPRRYAGGAVGLIVGLIMRFSSRTSRSNSFTVAGRAAAYIAIVLVHHHRDLRRYLGARRRREECDSARSIRRSRAGRAPETFRRSSTRRDRGRPSSPNRRVRISRKVRSWCPGSSARTAKQSPIRRTGSNARAAGRGWKSWRACKSSQRWTSANADYAISAARHVDANSFRVTELGGKLLPANYNLNAVAHPRGRD